MISALAWALGKGWRKWLKLAEWLGNLQMVILLALIYWILLAAVALPFKYLADPLALRRPGRSRWVVRGPASQSIESMRKQG